MSEQLTTIKTEPNWDEIADYAQGTCKADYEIAAEFNLSDSDADKLHEELNDRDVVHCGGCGWWCEMSEMEGDSGDGERCGDCTEEGR
jgi:hypothetical protein